MLQRRLYIERVLYIYDYLVFQHAIIAAYSPSPIHVLVAKSESDARHVIGIYRIIVSIMGAVSARNVRIGVNAHTAPWMVSLQQSKYRLIYRTTTRSNPCSAPTVTSLTPRLSYISANMGTYQYSINYDRSCTLYLNNSDKHSWHLRTNSFL